LAGIFGALRLMGQKLSEQRFLFLGVGSAATGIAELISLAMAQEGMDLAAARRCNALFDINGLLVTSCTDLVDFQKSFAQDQAPVSTFVEAVEALRPTAIIGVSTVPKRFKRGDPGNGENQRAPDHLPVFEPDLVLRMHGRGGLSLVRSSSEPARHWRHAVTSATPTRGMGAELAQGMGEPIADSKEMIVTIGMYAVQNTEKNMSRPPHDEC
jgi:hypothetical protein